MPLLNMGNFKSSRMDNGDKYTFCGAAMMKYARAQVNRRRSN